MCTDAFLKEYDLLCLLESLYKLLLITGQRRVDTLVEGTVLHTYSQFLFVFLLEKTDSIPGAHLDISVYFYAVALIASLVLFLCVTSAAFKM